MIIVLPILMLFMGCSAVQTSDASSKPEQAHAAQGDPSGTRTGAIADVFDAEANPFIPMEPKEPKREAFVSEIEFRLAKEKYVQAKAEYEDFTKDAAWQTTAIKLANAVGHDRVSINMVWTLICGFLIMVMQPGFAMIATGLTRAKNASHTMAMMFMIYPLSMFGFYACGYAFMFGGSGNAPTLGGPSVMDGMWNWRGWNLLGTKGFFLSGNFYDVSVYAIFFFQMVFLLTTASLPAGAAAERWKFKAFCLFGFAVGAVIYPVYGGWVWGGGWCSQLGTKLGLGHGTVDFAGSSIVHLQGGILAFWVAKFIGPRIGKYNPDGTTNAIAAHSVPLCVIGTLITAFGWFGFNAGSSISGADLRIAVCVTNTMLASGAGAVASMIWVWTVRGNKPDPTMMCNGMLAGLVAITGPCAYVPSWAACVIGLVAGALVVESAFFVERKLKIDDPVGGISVNGVNGLWGLVAIGLFADGTYPTWGVNQVAGPIKGLFYGDPGQFKAQLVGAAACLIYVSLSSIIIYGIIQLVIGNRVPKEVELEGLDIPETGVAGYSGLGSEQAPPPPAYDPHLFSVAPAETPDPAASPHNGRAQPVTPPALTHEDGASRE